MRYASSLKSNAVVAIAIIALASCILAIYTVAERRSDAAIARSIVATCERVPGDHSACYESGVPNLYPRYPVLSLFDIVRQIRQLDPSYQYCHVLGHKIGERVVAEDPKQWVNAIPLNPADGLCSNGFIHGVVGGRFRSEVLDDATIEKFLPDFTIACAPHDDWNPSDLDRSICYHGIGHLFDFITNADIQKALSLCDSVAPSEYRRVCVQGVFMQIYQPLEPDDFALIAQMHTKPSTTTVQSYCARFRSDPMAHGSCIEESWPYLQPHISDGTAAQRLCDTEPNSEERGYCYTAMSSLIGRMSLQDPNAAAKACSAFPDAEQARCFSYSAEAILEEDRTDSKKAIALCEKAPAAIMRSCIALLLNHSEFLFGDNRAEYQAFCAALPEGAQCPAL